MITIHNRFIPFPKFAAINICGIIFVRKGVNLSKKELNHEYIHTLQQREMLFIFFFLWYVMEWIVRIAIHRNILKAYTSISFEREAYKYMNDLDYKNHRKHYAWSRELS